MQAHRPTKVVLDASSPRRTAGQEEREPQAHFIEVIGQRIIRYGLAVVILWIGAMKFTAYEAAGIQPLVAHSPLMAWMYDFLGVRGVSNLLGVVEILTAVLIASRSVSAWVCAAGSAMAIGMFLTALTFLFSTPGWEPSLGGFPALSALPGQFLVKDVVLLGAAVWVARRCARCGSALMAGGALDVVPRGPGTTKGVSDELPEKYIDKVWASQRRP
jgi:uncharacterized membrane protein YkgB